MTVHRTDSIQEAKSRELYCDSKGGADRFAICNRGYHIPLATLLMRHAHQRLSANHKQNDERSRLLLSFSKSVGNKRLLPVQIVNAPKIA